jgi:hypothetical protein
MGHGPKPQYILILFFWSFKLRKSLFLVSQMHNVHFFCFSKRNEPKKKSPEMITSAKTGARYTGLNGATVLAEVRAISGLPSHDSILRY